MNKISNIITLRSAFVLYYVFGTQICNSLSDLKIYLGIPFAQWTAEEVSGKKQQWLDLPNKFPFFLIQKN